MTNDEIRESIAKIWALPQWVRSEEETLKELQELLREREGS